MNALTDFLYKEVAESSFIVQTKAEGIRRTYMAEIIKVKCTPRMARTLQSDPAVTFQAVQKRQHVKNFLIIEIRKRYPGFTERT